MEKIVIDALGKQCPIPVVLTKKAAEALTEPAVLETHVDNATAVENLSRFAAGKNFKYTTAQLAEDHFTVTIEAEAVSAEESGEACCASFGNGDLVVAITSDVMGSGNDELGAVLIKGFVFALTQLPKLPAAVICYNGGVKLTAEGSPCLEDLKKMEEQGVEILSCGTCLNYYGLGDKLAVGSVTNMYSIVEKLANASSVIRP